MIADVPVVVMLIDVNQILYLRPTSSKDLFSTKQQCMLPILVGLPRVNSVAARLYAQDFVGKQHFNQKMWSSRRFLKDTTRCPPTVRPVLHSKQMVLREDETSKIECLILE
jgi:hypothetical protein